MLTEIIFLIVFAFIGFASLIATIVGLVKKKKPIWLGGLGGIFVSAIVVIIMGIMVAAGAVNKVGETVDGIAKEDVMNAVDEVSEFAGEAGGKAASGLAKGLDSGLDEEKFAGLAHKSGVILGKSTGEGVKGIEEGLDESVGKVQVYISKNLETQGVVLGRSEEHHKPDYDDGSTVSVFLVFNKDYSGTLELNVFDSEDLIKGSTSVVVNEKAGSKKYLDFDFGEKSTVNLSGYCIISSIDKS